MPVIPGVESAWRPTLPLALGVFFCLFTLQPHLDERSMGSKTPVQDYRVEASSTDLALQKIARDLKISIGINTGRLPYVNKQVSIFIKDGTAADAFNAVTAEDGQYTWTETSGSVEFKARKAPLTLPDVEVAAFTVETKRPEQIDVSEIPEVKHWMDDNSCPQRNMVSVGGGQAEGGPQVSVHLARVRLRDVLNALARQTGSYAWSVGAYESGGRCYSRVSF